MTAPGVLTPDLTGCWERVHERLRTVVGDAAFNSWLRQLQILDASDGKVRLTVPTRFMRDWVITHYAGKIRDLWCDECGSFAEIDINVRAASRDDTVPAQPAAHDPAGPDAPADLASELGAPLDPRFTFDNFVVGKANELAYARGRRVAEAPQVPFNPLYLYGGVGLGKTHLMHAMGWHIRTRNPDRKVIYLSAEKFMYQFIRALRYKDVMQFKHLFRSVDVLMIDDVQFISGKESTQEEFFHTFNALVDQNRQIVISGDRSPSNLDGVQERMRSRLGWGLVADIHATDYELRVGILQSKVQQLGEKDVPKQVLDFLAHRITSNVRELEGALNRVLAFSNLVGRPITLGNDPGSAARPAARQRPAYHDRGHPEAGRRALQHAPVRDAFATPCTGRGAAPAGRDVPGQTAHVTLAAGDWPYVRRARPHDRHACRQADQRAPPER